MKTNIDEKLNLKSPNTLILSDTFLRECLYLIRDELIKYDIFYWDIKQNGNERKVFMYNHSNLFVLLHYFMIECFILDYSEFMKNPTVNVTLFISWLTENCELKPLKTYEIFKDVIK